MNRARGLMVVAGSVAALIVCGVASGASLVNSSNIVAFGGGTAPGLDVGETIAFNTNTIDNPLISDSGRINFNCNIAGPNVVNANRNALYQQDALGNLQLIARNGMLVPGFPVADNVRFQTTTGNGGITTTSPRPTASGALVIYAQYSGTNIVTTGTNANINNSGIFIASGGTMTQVVRRGDLIPGSSTLKFNSTFSGLSHQSLCANDSNGLSFIGDLRNADNTAAPTASNQGFFVGVPGGSGSTALTMVMRKGDTPLGAGTPTIASFQFVNQINGSGQAVFTTKFTQGTFGSDVVGVHSDDALWFYNPGQGLTMVVREGQTCAAAGGATLDSPTAFSGWSPGVSASGFNNAGQVDFYAQFAPGTGSPVVDSTNDTALCRWDSTNGIQIVARKGDAVPGLPGVVLTTIHSSNHYMNSHGTIGFSSFMAGPGVDTTNDFGLFLGTPGNIQLVVREGTPLPELGPDITVAPQSGTTFFFNALNQFMFKGTLSGTGVTIDNSDCLMAWGPNTGLIVLWRAGDTFQVAPGDVRTAIGTTGGDQFCNGNGRQLCLADNGRAGMRVFFADQSNAAVNFVIPTCLADFDDGTGTGNPDGGVTIDDLLFYLAQFEAGNPRADVDNGTFTGTKDGGITIDDLLYYLFRFEAGC